MKIDSQKDYIKYFDKISPDNKLVEDTKRRMTEELNSTVYQENHIIVYKKIAAAAACFAIVGSAVLIVPKLKNAPVSTKPAITSVSSQPDGNGLICETTVSDPGKGITTSLTIKTKESVPGSSAELPVTTANKENTKSPVVSQPVKSKSVSESSVSVSESVRAAESSGNTDKTVDPDNSGVVTENAVSSAAETVTQRSSDENSVKDPEISDSIHSIGGGSGSEQTSADPVQNQDKNETKEYTYNGEKYIVNLLSNVDYISESEKASDDSSYNCYHYKNNSDEKKEKCYSEIRAFAEKNSFDSDDIVPEYLIDNKNDFSLSVGEDFFIYEFDPSHSGASGKDFISLGISGTSSDPAIKPAGYNMISTDKMVSNSINGIDFYLGNLVKDKCYCVSFEHNGLQYRILFKEYDFGDIIKYIQTLSEK